MKSRYNHILLVIILLSLVCGLWLVYNRHKVEVRNDTVEMVMDYQILKRIAEWEGLNERSVLNQFKDAGITTLAVYDTTLEKLSAAGKVAVLTPMTARLYKDVIPVGMNYDAFIVGKPAVEGDTTFDEVRAA